MTNFLAYFIGYCFVPITAFVTVLFLVLLIDEDFDLGLMDRIVDALELINKRKGIR